MDITGAWWRCAPFGRGTQLKQQCQREQMAGQHGDKKQQGQAPEQRGGQQAGGHGPRADHPGRDYHAAIPCTVRTLNR